jgi:glutathione S-transferase
MAADGSVAPLPLEVYGLAVSYFTGKLEMYLRYKEIPHRLVPMTLARWERVVPRATGARQMPAVRLADGRWMTDTTPMIEWFESQYPRPPVIPADPLQAFFSRLLEDYADEWLWRPALHYRWSYRRDAQMLSRCIAGEMLGAVPAPLAWKSWFVRRRQTARYARGDGVTATTRQHVESIYLDTLDRLSAVLRERPFLLGEAPTLADFGFAASMFRHFSHDPTPAAIMCDRAPAVRAWVERMWTARSGHAAPRLAAGVPADWELFLDDVGCAYLPYLAANAEAWKAGRKRFDAVIDGVPYPSLPTSRYRVWCLERLREHYAGLVEGAAGSARRLLEKHACWAPLWRVADPVSGYDVERRAPFGRGIAVFGATRRAAG